MLGYEGVDHAVDPFRRIRQCHQLHCMIVSIHKGRGGQEVQTCGGKVDLTLTSEAWEFPS